MVVLRVFPSLFRESGISLSFGVMSALNTMCHSESRLPENLHLEVDLPCQQRKRTQVITGNNSYDLLITSGEPGIVPELSIHDRQASQCNLPLFMSIFSRGASESTENEGEFWLA